MKSDRKSQKKHEEFLLTPAEYTILLALSDLRICSAANAAEAETTEDESKTESQEKGENDEHFFLISWSDYVFKVPQPKSDGDSSDLAMKEFKFYSTALYMKSKIQNEPIFIKLVRGSQEDLGSTQIEFSDCFVNSLGCEEFHAQTITAQCKFTSDEKTKAIVDVSLKLMREASLCREDEHDDEGSETEEGASESDLSDFHCNNDAAADTLKLEESSYKVIDGRLVKLDADATGALKCTDLFKAENCVNCECLPSSDVRSMFAVTCPRCGGKKTSNKAKQNNQFEENAPASSFNKWMDRNAKEEDILNRLCLKHGVSLAEIRGGMCKSLKNESKSKVKSLKRQVSRTLKSQCQLANSKCPVEEESTADQTEIQSCKPKKKKPKRSKYFYKFGKSFEPKSTEIHCEITDKVGDGPSVPKNMGWRWDSVNFGASNRPRSWIPGKINSTVRCLMKNMLDPFPLDTLNLTRRDSKGHIVEITPKPSSVVEKKPTLTIKKRDGEYLITMHPLKDKSKLVTDFEPYLNCSPLTFRICANGEASTKQKAKKILASQGFVKKCSCPNLDACYCIEPRRKKLILAAIEEVGTQLNMKKPLDYDDMAASSDSELDIEFVAPAAEAKIGKRVANLIHTGTQYVAEDFVADFEKKLIVEKSLVKPNVTRTCCNVTFAHTFKKTQ